MSALYSRLTGFLPITKCSAPGLLKTIGAPYDEAKAKPGIASVCRIAATTADAAGLDCGVSTRTPAPVSAFVPQVDLPGLVITTDPDFQFTTTQPARVRAASIEVAKPSASGSGANTLTSNLVPGKVLAACVTALASMDRGVVSSASLSDRRRLSFRNCSDSSPSPAISVFAVDIFAAASALYVARSRSFWSESRALKRYWATPATTVRLVAIAAIIPKPKYALSAQTSHFSGDIFTPYDIVLMIVIIVCGLCVAGCAAFALHDVNQRERARLAGHQPGAAAILPALATPSNEVSGPERWEGVEV